jgi:hypothetical protein
MARRLIALAALVTSSACAGGDEQEPTGPTQPTIATIEVSPAQVHFDAIGITQQFSAVARTASGTVVGGQQIAWVSSDASVVTVEANGLATTTGNGAATITASSVTISGAASVTVQQEIVEITLSADSLVLDRWADTARVSAVAVDAAGTPVAGISVTWTSSNAEVAAIDEEGLITTWLDGEAEITAEVTITGSAALAWAESSPQGAAGLQTTATLPVRVAVQRNPLCQVPAGFPAQPGAAQPATWVEQEVDGHFETVEGGGNIGRPMTLDVDQDGDADLILMRSGAQHTGEVPETEVRVWLNEGGGSFSDGTLSMLANDIPWAGPGNVRYADLNGDGLEDAFVPQTGWELLPCGPPGACAGAPTILLIQQAGGGLIDAAPTAIDLYESNSFTHAGTLADVDCDGDVDLFEGQMPNGDAWTWPHLRMNQGSGAFLTEDFRLPRVLTELASSIIPGTGGAVFCDLDRDGDSDLVHNTNEETPPDGGATFVSVNDGFGHFRRLPGMLNDMESWHFVCGDLNLDGFNDLVLATQDGLLEIYENQGDMTFQDVTASSLPGGNSDGGLHPVHGLVDLNNDGWPDLVPGAIARAQSVLWNTGEGFFDERPLTGNCGCGTDLAIADFDGDGRLDIYWDSAESRVNSGRTTEYSNIILWNR